MRQTNIHQKSLTAWCQHFSVKHKVYRRTARLDWWNTSPCPWGHRAEENAGDPIRVRNAHIWGRLVSSMCECVYLSVPQPASMTKSVCVRVCVSVLVSIDSAGVKDFQMSQLNTILKTCCTENDCTTESYTNRTRMWPETFKHLNHVPMCPPWTTHIRDTWSRYIYYLSRLNCKA